MAIDRKRCNYVDSSTGKKCRSITPLINGFCIFHGGVGKKTQKATAAYRSKLNAQVKKIKEGANISGETIDKSIERIEQDPYYRDLNYEVNVLAAMIESVQKEITNYGPTDPEYKMLFEQMTKMTDVRSKSRERFARISASYVDIYALKLVITQIVSMFSTMKASMSVEFANEDGNLNRILKIIDGHIADLDKVKLPLIREIK